MDDINTILAKENLGKLSGAALDHAYGCTNKGIWVWLPLVSFNDYWINNVLPSDEVIIQLGKTQSNHQKQPPNWGCSGIVITRDIPKCVYQRLPGEYCAVFFDESICLTIHARNTLSIAQGTLTSSGTISWLTGFAATAEEAREKAGLFRKKARLN